MKRQGAVKSAFKACQVATGAAYLWYKNKEEGRETETQINSREKFDQNGYLFLPNAIVDPLNLYCPPPVDTDGKRLVGQQIYIRHH